MSLDHEEKSEFHDEKSFGEKGHAETLELNEETPLENSKIEAVRLVVPVTDDPTLVAITFRFWVISFIFAMIGAVIQQYYFYRAASGSFSIFFVNLASYGIGKSMARILPTSSFSIGGYSMSLNPGPFNIKEHALIGIAAGTAATSAYAIDILSATDIYLDYRINAVGSLVLIITTQCVGYGMAGILRKYLVYPAEMVWWSNLVQVVFYNAMHNTGEFSTKKMVRGWSYMKFFWVVCGCMFVWEFLPQWLAPILMYFDWFCWINPFNFNFWALGSSMLNGGGLLSLSFDWTSIGGTTLYYPFAAQLCSYSGQIFNYWILLPIMWMGNVLSTKTMGKPLTSRLFFENGTAFDIKTVLLDDFSVNSTKYDSGPQANMAPLYAIGFMFSFVALAGCISHIFFFHGTDIWKTWKQVIDNEGEDIHTKMMKVYPEVPQLWYAIFYVVMAALSIVVCEVYHLQLPWWGLLLALFVGWALTLPICAMNAITGFGPGLNVITELICGYILPGKPIANMVFKCYGYMAMAQCANLLSDLKLGHYMKIPPRSMFVAQFWGTVVGGIFNYITMILIIDSQREVLSGRKDDPTGLWTNQRVETYWGSGLIYGALGPARMFALDGKYGFVYLGFLIGFVVPGIQWVLTKKFPSVKWSKFNIAIIAGGMNAFPNGYVNGITLGLATCITFQYYMFRYHKGWWKKYVMILAAALDTGAAFTGLVVFLFLGGGVSPTMNVIIPSWWGNHHDDTNENNAPYIGVNRCGAFKGKWESGKL